MGTRTRNTTRGSKKHTLDVNDSISLPPCASIDCHRGSEPEARPIDGVACVRSCGLRRSTGKLIDWRVTARGTRTSKTEREGMRQGTETRTRIESKNSGDEGEEGGVHERNDVDGVIHLGSHLHIHIPTLRSQRRRARPTGYECLHVSVCVCMAECKRVHTRGLHDVRGRQKGPPLIA